jgi:hypothetical protein
MCRLLATNYTGSGVSCLLVWPWLWLIAGQESPRGAGRSRLSGVFPQLPDSFDTLIDLLPNRLSDFLAPFRSQQQPDGHSYRRTDNKPHQQSGILLVLIHFSVSSIKIALPAVILHGRSLTNADQ